MSGSLIAPEHRDLTSHECRLLEWLIANGNDRAPAYAYQFSQVKVVARCTCGCATTDLAALGEKKSPTVGASTILDTCKGARVFSRSTPVGVSYMHVKERFRSLR